MEENYIVSVLEFFLEPLGLYHSIQLIFRRGRQGLNRIREMTCMYYPQQCHYPEVFLFTMYGYMPLPINKLYILGLFHLVWIVEIVYNIQPSRHHNQSAKISHRPAAFSQIIPDHEYHMEKFFMRIISF